MRPEDTGIPAVKCSFNFSLRGVTSCFGHDSAQYVELLDLHGDYAKVLADTLISELEPGFFRVDSSGKPYLKVQLPHAGGMSWWCRADARNGDVMSLCIGTSSKSGAECEPLIKHG